LLAVENIGGSVIKKVSTEWIRGYLDGLGGERPFSHCESARSATHSREHGPEMTPEKLSPQ
jgi:hypothetical protein